MHAEADVLQSAYCDHSCCNKGLASAVRLSFITVILPAHCSIYSSMRVHLLLWWSLLFQGVASFTRMTTVKAHTQTHTQRRLSASAMSRHGERVNGQWCSQSCIMFCSSFSVNRELFHQCRECDNTGNAHTSLVGTQRESQQPFPLFQADTGKKNTSGKPISTWFKPLKKLFCSAFYNVLPPQCKYDTSPSTLCLMGCCRNTWALMLFSFAPVLALACPACKRWGYRDSINYSFVDEPK